jgi:hypothetical protein
MPTVTLTTETRAGMGVSRDDLVPVLTLRARDSVVVWPAPVGDSE